MNQHPSFYNLIKLIHDIENNITIVRVNNESNNSMILKLLLVTMLQIQDQEATQEQAIDVLQSALVKQATCHERKIDTYKRKIHKLNSEINLQKRLHDHMMNNTETERYFTLAEPSLAQDDQCCVCMEKQKNYAFTGCGHMCVCGDCVDRCLNKCPLCRAEGSYMRIIY